MPVVSGPPPGGDQDLGPAVMAVLWTETAIAILAVAARFAGRWLVHRTGWDDWLMLLTLVGDGRRNRKDQ